MNKEKKKVYLQSSFLPVLNFGDVDAECFSFCYLALLAGAVEYTNCFSAEGKTTPNECPGHDTKQSDGAVPAMLELWGMRSTPLLPSLPGPLYPGLVAPDKGPIYRLNKTKRWLAFTVFIHLNCIYAELNCLK